MARYDTGNGRYGGDYWDAGYTGGGFADGGSYYGGGGGGGGYYAGTGGWYGGYDAPRYDRGYRGPGTDLGEDIRRGYVGRGLYTRAAVGPGSRGSHEYDRAGGYGPGRYRDEWGRGPTTGRFPRGGHGERFGWG